ncbi:hypothetical protein [Clavibacter michiganensis]|uniref:hypothetical protein n=1 Tax=Clavibacter michiganensis TaxID=28447 RepID=UPI0012699EBE|nr:hypothetical protein [Clavibacter michiganensis]
MYYTPAEDVTVEAAIRHKTRIIDLAIVVRGDDRPVSAVIEHAAGCMWNDDAATELGAFRAATEVVPLWFRGGCKTEEIFDLYTQKAALWAGIRRAADEAERAEESPY